MKARVEFIAGGILILGTAGSIMASSIAATGLTRIATSELAARAATDGSFGKRKYQVGARAIVGGSIPGDKSAVKVGK